MHGRTNYVLPCCNSTYRLRYWNLYSLRPKALSLDSSCNSTYRLRYWNMYTKPITDTRLISCNSAYRLRYWNTIVMSCTISFVWFIVATEPTVHGMRRRVWASRGAKWRWGPQTVYLNEVKVKRRWAGNSAYRSRYWNNTPETSSTLRLEML